MREVLQDRYHRVIGYIIHRGNKLVLQGFGGEILGTYDGEVTKDFYGNIVGYGNLLAALLDFDY